MAKFGCSKVVAKEVKHRVQKVLVYEPLKSDQHKWGPKMAMEDRACLPEQMRRSCMPKLCECPSMKGKTSLILNKICFGAKIVAFVTLVKISIDAGIFGEQIEPNRLVDSMRIYAKKLADEKEEKKNEKDEKKDEKEDKKNEKEKPNEDEAKKPAKKDEPKTVTAAKDEKETKNVKKVENSEATEYESEWTLGSVWNTLVVRLVKSILDLDSKVEEKLQGDDKAKADNKAKGGDKAKGGEKAKGGDKAKAEAKPSANK